ncbi:hypothetical protein AB0J83_18450 [Actinoplanes sp. NPDC049596]|uniref:hypothetical protein n=1 Tax=unclassified Actinoplanes TaxID=2626549 RepID=UPI00344822F1
MTAELGGRMLPLPDSLRHHVSLRKYLGKPLVIGLRPAAFSPADDDGPALEVVPLGVESLGDEKHVLLAPPADGLRTAADRDVPVAVDESAGTQLWTAKVGQGADVAIGRPVRLTADLGAASFFDPGNGTAIATPSIEPAVPAAA